MPLICIHIVEWHYPDCVLHQFGIDQPVPTELLALEQYHGISLKGQNDWDWSIELVGMIQIWKNWESRVCNTRRLGNQAPTKEYLQWYWNVTCRWIHPNIAVWGHVVKYSFFYNTF